MVEKTYITTKHPFIQNSFVKGELVNVKSREEKPNVYHLEDGTILYVYLNIESVSLPIDPDSKEYFKDKTGEKVYNADYHLKLVVGKKSMR